MRIGKRIMYDTMNSWNGQKSLAYNLKIYNVIRSDLRQKAYEFFGDDNISCELYADIDSMIDDFTHSCNCCYTAGFNGRSGGYLVLYKSSKIVQHKDDGTMHTRIVDTCKSDYDWTTLEHEDWDRHDDCGYAYVEEIKGE